MLAVGTAVFGASHLFTELNAQCNGFTRIQKAVVDQIGSRSPNIDHDLFFGASLALESSLELLLCTITDLVVV